MSSYVAYFCDSGNAYVTNNRPLATFSDYFFVLPNITRNGKLLQEWKTRNKFNELLLYEICLRQIPETNNLVCLDLGFNVVWYDCVSQI